MPRPRAIAAVLLAGLLVTACGGSADKSDTKQSVGGSGSLGVAATTGAAAAATTAATPQVTTTPMTTIDWHRLEKYIPADESLPDRVSVGAKVDLSNEQATTDPAQLKQFRDTGRLTGIQFILSVEAGARTMSIGISYYNNTDEPKKMLRNSGDPSATTAPNRFTVPSGLGDEYIAQRGQFGGAGESALNVINLVWVRGRYFISMFEVGGPPDNPTDNAIRVAKLIDDKLKTDPTP